MSGYRYPVAGADESVTFARLHTLVLQWTRYGDAFTQPEQRRYCLSVPQLRNRLA